MCEGLPLDGNETRYLGSLAQDVGIEQAFVRESKPLSLWERLLTGVRVKFVYRDFLQQHHYETAWKTMEEDIQLLREMALFDIPFEKDGQPNHNLNNVRCTSQMWLMLKNPGMINCSDVFIYKQQRPLLNLTWRRHETVGQEIYSCPGNPSTRVEGERKRETHEMWIRWPGTSDPQEYKASVDTGTQCMLMPSGHVRPETISISGVPGGSQELTVLEDEVSLTRKDWQKHPIVTGPDAPCIHGIDYLRNGYFKDPKEHRWGFGIAAVETEVAKQLNSLPDLLKNPSAVGLLKAEEQRVPIATTTVRRQQY
ncbi:hypothetical protein BTVI_64546 [Pitangus sulphuratus]|nr:hypothetical protein BTVI_64546 [Pitangus sulphuratus]